MAITGLAGATGVAGCLGDDAEVGDEPDDGDDTDDVDAADDTDDGDDLDPADDTDDGDDTDGEEPTAELVELHDATAHWTHGNDLPPDIQFNPYADGPGLTGNAFTTRNEAFVIRSVYDLDLYGLLVDDGSYEPGVLEFTLHDDFYWWSGDQVTIDDFLAHLEFEDNHLGGDELDAFSSIVTRERIDDHTARLALADAWTEAWALNETLLQFKLDGSRAFFGPWNEEFEDAGDLDAIEAIREDVTESPITDDDGLVNMYHTMYEFRLDGSIGSVGEDFIEYEAIQEKDGNIRHWANPDTHDILPNTERIRVHLREERPRELRMELFLDQDAPHIYGQDNPEAIEMHNDGEFDFQTRAVSFPRPPNDQGGMQFNHETHPSDDPHFRRAMAYLTDNTAWESHPEAFPAEAVHSFLSSRELEAFVSSEVIDAFTDYRYDEMAIDAAETELESGGYERDADGNWLMLEDGVEADDGEPMDFVVDHRDFMPYVLDQATDWWADLENFGIQTEVVAGNFEDDDWTFTYSYTGGGTPDQAFDHVFNDAAPSWSRRDQNIPSTVLAPEFLATEDAPANVDDWVEYDVGPMTDRLPVTTEVEQYQQLVDQLAWVINQSCNHFSVAPVQRTDVLNDERWSWPAIEDLPERYSGLLMGIGARLVNYVPEDER